MKKQDFLFIIAFCAFFAPFFLSETVFNFYETFNREHSLITSFLKFALLATTGEVIGLRLRTGHYNRKGFGILPRAVVWGFLGITIKVAFVVFATGVPVFLTAMGIDGIAEAMKGDLSGQKILAAFCISAFMNLVYAPVMMTFHKITDTHIVANGGTLSALLKPLRIGNIMQQLDWQVQWHFVFKKTIPFFWIPAHTITFLLPVDYQVLFAAILGVMLGVILAIASLKSKPATEPIAK